MCLAAYSEAERYGRRGLEAETVRKREGLRKKDERKHERRLEGENKSVAIVI